MKNFIPIILITFISFACSSNPANRALPQKNIASDTTKNLSSKLNRNKTISNNTNIHYNINYCTECHINNPKNPEIGKQDLKFGGDYKILCKCHDEGPTRELHPVDIIPSQEIKARIPSGFPLSDGKITCSTCHDIYMQCKDIDRIYLRQVKFLRGGPYNSSQGRLLGILPV